MKTHIFIILISSALACCGESQKRKTLAITALDDGTAVVVWEDSSGQWIGRTGLDTRLTWSNKLQGRVRWPQPEQDFVFADGVVAVRTQQREASGTRALLEGFSLQDGAHWSEVLGVLYEKTDIDHDSVIQRPRYAFGGMLHEVFLGERRFSRAPDLVTIDPRTGFEIRRTQLPFEPWTAVLATNIAILRQGFTRAASVSTSGEVQETPNLKGGCVVDGSYWQLAEPAPNRFELVSEDHARHISLGLEQLESPLLEDCARNGDRLVLFFSVSRTVGDRNEQVRVINRDGSLAGKLDVASITNLKDLLRHQRELPRFVPLQLRRKVMEETGVYHEELVMIDLNDVSIAWRIDEEAFYFLSAPFRVANRWYLVDGLTSPRIAIIDTNTGRLVTAKRVEAMNGIDPIRWWNVSERAMWLRRANRDLETEPSIIKLDPVTLQRIDGARIEVTAVETQLPFSTIPRH